MYGITWICYSPIILPSSLELHTSVNMLYVYAEIAPPPKLTLQLKRNTIKRHLNHTLRQFFPRPVIPGKLNVTAIVYGGKFKFAVATIWWVMVSLGVLIGWIWRHLLESDRLPFPTVSILLPEILSRLSCDSSLILEPATMMNEALYSKVCIQCHPCLIIGNEVFYLGLSGGMYPELSVVVIILRRLINLWRYFVGISWGFFHLLSGNHATRENIFRNL